MSMLPIFLRLEQESAKDKELKPIFEKICKVMKADDDLQEKLEYLQSLYIKELAELYELDLLCGYYLENVKTKKKNTSAKVKQASLGINKVLDQIKRIDFDRIFKLELSEKELKTQKLKEDELKQKLKQKNLAMQMENRHIVQNFRQCQAEYGKLKEECSFQLRQRCMTMSRKDRILKNYEINLRKDIITLAEQHQERYKAETLFERKQQLDNVLMSKKLSSSKTADQICIEKIMENSQHEVKPMWKINEIFKNRFAIKLKSQQLVNEKPAETIKLRSILKNHGDSMDSNSQNSNKQVHFKPNLIVSDSGSSYSNSQESLFNEMENQSNLTYTISGDTDTSINNSLDHTYTIHPPINPISCKQNSMISNKESEIPVPKEIKNEEIIQKKATLGVPVTKKEPIQIIEVINLTSLSPKLNTNENSKTTTKNNEIDQELPNSDEELYKNTLENMKNSNRVFYEELVKNSDEENTQNSKTSNVTIQPPKTSLEFHSHFPEKCFKKPLPVNNIAYNRSFSSLKDTTPQSINSSKSSKSLKYTDFSLSEDELSAENDSVDGEDEEKTRRRYENYIKENFSDNEDGEATDDDLLKQMMGSADIFADTDCMMDSANNQLYFDFNDDEQLNSATKIDFL